MNDEDEKLWRLKYNESDTPSMEDIKKMMGEISGTLYYPPTSGGHEPNTQTPLTPHEKMLEHRIIELEAQVQELTKVLNFFKQFIPED